MHVLILSTYTFEAIPIWERLKWERHGYKNGRKKYR